jgi:DNA-directed RNA polymerase subunit RPC12/RpoP
VVKNTEIKGPCIVLCSHGSFLDFVYALSILYKKKPHFIIARLYFYKKLFNKTLRAGGAFPKSMYAADIENVKNCITVLKGNDILAMMPEAHLSTVGCFEDIHESTIKFIKKMGVDVYGIRINGSFFAKPKWGDKIRKGAPVDAEFTQILTAEQVKTLSSEEVYAKVSNAIYYNDFEWLDKNYPEHIYTHKTIAEGLENVLYKCPNCGEEFTIETKGREVFCSKCGYKEIVNERYGFDDNSRFKNFAEWFNYQTELLKQEIISNSEYELVDNVTLKMRSKTGKKMLDVVGEGVCTLNRNGFTYQGTINGETIKKEFSIKNMVMLLYGAGEDFEIYEGTDIYYFVPTELKSCVKWHLASVILKELSEQN